MKKQLILFLKNHVSSMEAIVADRQAAIHSNFQTGVF